MRTLALLAGLLLATALEARAQSGTPVLLLQPGMMTADFVSSDDGEPSTTGFNLRFATVLPTSRRWLTLIVGANVTPYGTSGASRRNTNTPQLFGGNVFPVLSARQTGGWLSVDVPLLLTYSFGGGSERNRRVYGRDVVLEGAATLHLGRQVLRGFGGPLSRLRVYAVVDQSLTPNRNLVGMIDRFNPVAFYGLTIPFGTSRESP